MYRTTTGLVAAVVGLLAIFATDASAQAPTLSATAVGNSVTIQWTPLPGVTGYTIGVGTAPGASNLADVNLPVFVNRIVVKAPAATYYLRVRGFVGTIVGPNSNEASVTVADQPAPPPCAPIGAPASVTAAASGLGVNVSWAPVAGAAGYQIQWSRQPNTTELVETTTATSVAKHVGFAGTFYVRVLAASPCGSTAVSQTASFTLAGGGGPAPTPGFVPSPGGNRTPNPPPGQMLPVPAYGEQVVLDMARRYPAQLARACKTNHEFLFMLLNELRKHDTRWGLNWKRGNAGSMSTDVVAYNATDQPDEGNGKVYLFDVIGAECERNDPVFINQTAVTWAAAGNPICGSGTFCTKWTLQPYLEAGLPAISAEEKK
jgi:hypothetical protein